MNNVYFTTGDGMTSTTANHYANIAQEVIQSVNERLDKVKFYDTFVSSITVGEKQQMAKGISDVSFINESLETVASMNAFCAWVREAIKEKESQTMDVSIISLESWAEKNNIELPVSPKYPDLPKIVSESEYIETMSETDRNKYLMLEAYASTYGKYIHPKGAFSIARKNLCEVVNNPIVKEGNGRDLILYYREPTALPLDVDDKFLELQGIYRNYEQQLNQMKADIKNAVNAINLENNNKYQVLLDEYNAKSKEVNSEYSTIRSKFSNWKTSEQERISKLKIVVPKALEDTFKKVKDYTKR